MLDIKSNNYCYQYGSNFSDPNEYITFINIIQQFGKISKYVCDIECINIRNNKCVAFCILSDDHDILSPDDHLLFTTNFNRTFKIRGDCEYLYNTSPQTIMCFECNIWINDDYTADTFYEANPRHYFADHYKHIKTGNIIIKCMCEGHQSCLKHIYEQFNTIHKVQLNLDDPKEMDRVLAKIDDIFIKRYFLTHFTY